MFKPFTQVSSDRSGLGLGLSIALKSVEADGGTLSVHSDEGSIGPQWAGSGGSGHRHSHGETRPHFGQRHDLRCSSRPISAVVGSRVPRVVAEQTPRLKQRRRIQFADS